MLEVLVEAATRSLVLAAVVWLVLRLPGLRDRRIQLTAWTIVLAASLLMPIATRVAAVVLPAGEVVLPPIGQPAPFDAGVRTYQGAGATPGLVPPKAAAPIATPAPIAAGEPMPRGDAAPRWPAWRSLASLLYLPASLLYLTVCGGLLIRLLIGLLLVSRIVRAAVPVRAHWTSGHDVRVSPEISAPATFGSVILLPPDHAAWSLQKRMAVLAHEAAHARRRDLHSQIAACLNRAIFWFNPLSWWLRRELSALAEAMSDDAAIRDLCDREAYAEILLEVSGTAPKLPGCLAMARPATVRARVERILAETSTPAFVSNRGHGMLMGGLMALVVMAAGPLTVSLSVPDPDETEPPAPHQKITIDPRLLDADVGFYQDKKSGSVAIVTRDGDHLITRRMGKQPYPEYPYTDHDFFLTNRAELNTFMTDASGAVVHVIRRYNGLATIFDRISPDTARRLQNEFDQRIVEEWAPHIPVKLDPDALDDFVGYYQLTPTQILTVTREAGQLFVENTIVSRRQVYPFSDHEFFYTTCAAQITFLKPPNGAATALIFHENGVDRTAQRVGADVAARLQRLLDDEQRPHAPISIDAGLLEHYVGRYGNSDATMTITRRGAHLIAQVMGSNRYGVYPYTGQDFLATEFPAQISFVNDAQGQIVQLVRHQNGEDVVFHRLDQTAFVSVPGTIRASR